MLTICIHFKNLFQSMPHSYTFGLFHAFVFSSKWIGPYVLTEKKKIAHIFFSFAKGRMG